MNDPVMRALVVGAHPDDIEFMCAGTVALWRAQGAEVTYCIVTDGSTGTQDRGLMGTGLHDVRHEEAERAAKVVGVEEVVWLGQPDGYVEYTLDLRRDVARVFRRYRPHIFVVMDTDPVVGGFFINHPDHRAVGQACLDVSMTAGTTPGHFPELLDEGLDPWRGLRELWIAGPGTRDRVIDISTTIELKIESLMCHVSQVGDSAEVGEWVRNWTAEEGKPQGFAHAETFHVLDRGPGFHQGEQEDFELDLATAPIHPPSTPPS